MDLPVNGDGDRLRLRCDRRQRFRIRWRRHRRIGRERQSGDQRVAFGPGKTGRARPGMLWPGPPSRHGRGRRRPALRLASSSKASSPARAGPGLPRRRWPRRHRPFGVDQNKICRRVPQRQQSVAGGQERSKECDAAATSPRRRPATRDRPKGVSGSTCASSRRPSGSSHFERIDASSARRQLEPRQLHHCRGNLLARGGVGISNVLKLING